MTAYVYICLLLLDATCCYVLLLDAICCYLMLFVNICCYLLLFPNKLDPGGGDLILGSTNKVWMCTSIGCRVALIRTICSQPRSYCPRLPACPSSVQSESVCSVHPPVHSPFCPPARSVRPSIRPICLSRPVAKPGCKEIGFGRLPVFFLILDYK